MMFQLQNEPYVVQKENIALEDIVVLTKPEEDENVCEWVLKAVHEMFHLIQEENISDVLSLDDNLNSFAFKEFNELNFPYIYYDDNILAIHKLEADRL